ncbi:MAG: rhodanese-like domain-containing protein [Gammaproteobacteria bacterium]|nr:rhodanese-like domain-containing protein [Gammaproteobacteria bacterium]MDH5802548.1 rhodanese-like domain-containing protein [Gammaproteobacteria bacterium]
MNAAKRWAACLVGVWGVLFLGVVNAAQWANPTLLVTADELKKHSNDRNWVIVDCRDLKDYIKGHIPGAISLGNRCKNALRDTTARVFRDSSKYERLFSKVGINNDDHIVFYYDGMGTLTDASVGFWVAEYVGHKNVHVLNGGLAAWRDAGQRLDSKPVIRKPSNYKVNVVAGRYGSTDEVLGIAKGAAKNSQLIDSRTKKEFQGSDIRAIRGGHVPNVTANISHVDTLAQKKNPKTGKLEPVAYLDPDAATKAFGSLDRNKRTLAYCQTGTRSTLTYLQLRLLGFKDPANWDESWRVYGSQLEFPVAGEQWFNFAGLNKKLKNLEKKIAALEKEKANK